jgi:hypothetical protein
MKIQVRLTEEAIGPMLLTKECHEVEYSNPLTEVAQREEITCETRLLK